MAEMVWTDIANAEFSSEGRALHSFNLADAQSQILLSALEHTADSVMICVKGGEILYANPAFERLTGYLREELIGKPAKILGAGKMPPGFYEEMFRVLDRGDVFRGTFISKTKSGEFFSEDKTITPIRDANGEISHYVSTGRDASDVHKSREMEVKLKAAEEAEMFKTNLLSTISHELRTPLAAILSYTSAILSYGDALGVEKVDEYLHHIEDRSRQLERLISDLLTMSRLESGNLPMQFETVNLQEEITELVGEWRLRGTLSLRSALPEHVVLAYIDPFRIRQVLQNLLENAEKYAGLNGTVVMSARKISNSEIEIAVTDCGHGVAPDELDLIFGRFHRSKRERIGSGAGIGLSICKAIVEAHRGEIRASLPEGGGLRVAFTVPIADD